MRPLDRNLWRRYTADAGQYGTTRQLLVTTMGTYCTYCEVPLSVSMPIEHKTAKSSFLTYDNKFSNLTLACTACNTWKGAYPDTGAGESFFESVKKKCNPKFRINDQDAWYWCALFNMVWPDITSGKGKDIGDPPKGLTNYIPFPDQTLSLFSYQSGIKTAAQLAADGVLRFHSGENATAPWATQSQYGVWVYPNYQYIQSFPGNSDVQTTRVLKTIVTLNLNFSNPWNLQAPDRRVASRTAAFRMATEALQMLAATIVASGGLVDGKNEPLPLVYNGIQMIRQMALATGHWSVWMTVFSGILGNATAPWNSLTAVQAKALINALFGQYALCEGVKRVFDNQPEPPMIFPGTDPLRSLLR